MPISVNGANGITFADGSIQNTGAAGFGFKNRIINGDMRIDQRGVTQTNPNPAYVTDRWNAVAYGSCTVAQSSTAPTGFTNSILWTTTTASAPSSGQWGVINQGIEGYNVADLGWGAAGAQSVMLSFWVRASATGTYSVGIGNATTPSNLPGTQTRSFVSTFTVNAVNTWEQKTIPITGDTAGTWLKTNGLGVCVTFDCGSGSNYQTSTLNSWQAGAYWRATGSNGIGNTSSGTLYITGVQLEKGSTATAFDYRNYGHELMLCQRYYERMEAQTQFWVPNTSYLSYGINLWQFRVPKRAAATVSAISGASITMDRFGIGSPTVTGSGIDSPTQYSARANVIYNTNYTCGEGITLTSTYWQASAEL
jgi:hypothetical protein